ncbi:hypothetical protein MFIFM68171_11104 [Madurella fahalii]|uniref:Uncharacterized protein n=1 Tax=Madurella fahalii TaxID=1157608 RepID=A0ABQ0GT36_9PEZI
MENRVPLPPSSASLPDHCAGGCDACSAEICAICRSRRCLFCVFFNANGDAIHTVGGQNLLSDRFEPAGWRCCCGSEHYLEPAAGRRNPDTHIRVEGPAADSAHDIRHTCRRRGHGHHPCFICKVINRYGEPIGWVGDGSVLPPNGPFSDHLTWCDENVEFVQRAAAHHSPLVLDSGRRGCWSKYDEAIASRCRIDSPIDKAKKSRLAEAKRDLAEAEKAAENIVAWATRLWNAAFVIKQRKATAQLW